MKIPQISQIIYFQWPKPFEERTGSSWWKAGPFSKKCFLLRDLFHELQKKSPKIDQEFTPRCTHTSPQIPPKKWTNNFFVRPISMASRVKLDNSQFLVSPNMLGPPSGAMGWYRVSPPLADEHARWDRHVVVYFEWPLDLNMACACKYVYIYIYICTWIIAYIVTFLDTAIPRTRAAVVCSSYQVTQSPRFEVTRRFITVYI